MFHAKHFPHAPAPTHFVLGAEPIDGHYEYGDEDDGLGYYEDGVKRTLTDEQIALFRHTEIQTIIRERERERECRQERSGSSGSVSAPKQSMESSSQVLSDPQPNASAGHGHAEKCGRGDRVQHGRVEKESQWTVASAKTKLRNAKNRKRYRENLRQREKERKRRRDRSEDEESDEWDPWHQANGPDAQKDTTVDLDY